MADPTSGGLPPSTGGYSWFPSPAAGGTTWGVLTCRDLGRRPGDGHTTLWPDLLDRLAAAWGQDACPLRRLGDLCTGLPRGRVTRPAGRWLLFHGDDAPIADGPGAVIRAFGLDGRDVRPAFDEHERMLPGDRRAVEDALGVALLPTPRGGSR